MHLQDSLKANRAHVRPCAETREPGQADKSGGTEPRAEAVMRGPGDREYRAEDAQMLEEIMRILEAELGLWTLP